MEDDDKIYGLIVQAQEMQKYALEFKGFAEDAVKKLPDATKNAVREAAKEYIIEGVERVSTSIQNAAVATSTASETLQQTLRWKWTIHALSLVLVAIVILAALYFGAGAMISYKTDELNLLNEQILIMEARINKLSKDGGKAIVTECGEQKRPCIRVDKNKVEYTRDNEVYMIIHGY